MMEIAGLPGGVHPFPSERNEVRGWLTQTSAILISCEAFLMLSSPSGANITGKIGGKGGNEGSSEAGQRSSLEKLQSASVCLAM